MLLSNFRARNIWREKCLRLFLVDVRRFTNAIVFIAGSDSVVRREKSDRSRRRVAVDIVFSVIVIMLRDEYIRVVACASRASLIASTLSWLAASPLLRYHRRSGLIIGSRRVTRVARQAPQLCRCRRRRGVFRCGRRPRPNVPGQRRRCSMTAGRSADI